jgi:hypothetical protein
VFSTSQTAVAFGINGASLMNESSLMIICAHARGFGANAASKDQT